MLGLAGAAVPLALGPADSPPAQLSVSLRTTPAGAPPHPLPLAPPLELVPEVPLLLPTQEVPLVEAEAPRLEPPPRSTALRVPPPPVATPEPRLAARAAPSPSAADVVALEAAASRGTRAEVLRRTLPVYPERCRRRGHVGEVRLALLVQTDGQPAEVRVERSAGCQRLDEAALEAVRGYAFRPATENGRPVSSRERITIRFTP